MAKKTVTEVVEIEAAAVVNALRDAGWPVGGPQKVTAVNLDGKPLEGVFGGLRFTYSREDKIHADMPPRAG